MSINLGYKNIININTIDLCWINRSNLDQKLETQNSISSLMDMPVKVIDIKRRGIKLERGEGLARGSIIMKRIVCSSKLKLVRILSTI